MRPPAAGILRLALLAYPPSFRKGYGDEMARCVRDLRDHGGMSRGRLGLHVAADVLLTAPRMRLETLMTRTIVVTATIAAAVALSLMFSPVALVLVPALLMLAVLGRRHDLPIAPDGSGQPRWRVHMLRGVAALGVAGVVLLINGGGELSEPLWAIWALSFVAGLSMLVLGLVVLVSQRGGRHVA